MAKTAIEQIGTILKKIENFDDYGQIYFHFGRIGDAPKLTSETYLKLPKYVEKIIELCDQEDISWEIKNGEKGAYTYNCKPTMWIFYDEEYLSDAEAELEDCITAAGGNITQGRRDYASGIN